MTTNSFRILSRLRRGVHGTIARSSMASAVITCPKCVKKFKGRDDLAGKKIKCPFCAHPFVVPKGTAQTAIQAPAKQGATQPGGAGAGGAAKPAPSPSAPIPFADPFADQNK